MKKILTYVRKPIYLHSVNDNRTTPPFFDNKQNKHNKPNKHNLNTNLNTNFKNKK